MQLFDRRSVPVPEFFQSRAMQASRMQLKEFFAEDKRVRAQTRPSYLRVELRDVSLLRGLDRLFHGKCAFCESLMGITQETSVYRFRPGSNASPAQNDENDHLYYAWLVNAWENLYPICRGCLPERRNHFPVEGARAPIPHDLQFSAYAEDPEGLWRDHPPRETSLLLDPCGDWLPHLHFEIHPSTGTLATFSDAGLETIRHFNLNRPELKQRRAQKLGEYMDALEFLVQSPERRPADIEALFDFSSMEFGGLCHLLCLQLEPLLKGSFGDGRSLNPQRFASVFIGRGRQARGLAVTLAQALDAERHAPLTEQEPPLPRLQSIELENFKGIERLCLSLPAQSTGFQQPALLILGDNAAGKSSILEATALALCSSTARGRLRLDPRKLPLDPRLMGGARTMASKRAQVVLTFDDSTRRTLTISGRSYQSQGQDERPPVFAYGAFRQYLNRTRDFGEARWIVNLFKSDVLLPNPEKWLLGLEQHDFDQVVRALREVLSIESVFKVIERDEAGRSRRCHIVTATGRTPLSHASSGYRSMLAMVCDIIRGLMDRTLNPSFEDLESARAVVLIDEVEAHLHPRWKIQIMRALRAALPEVTFIATTHDPLCLRGMQEGEVVVMQRVPSGKRTDTQLPVMVEQVVRLPNVSQLTVEQLLTSDFFSLTSTDQPDTERELAHFADLLSARERGEPLTAAQQEAWRSLERDIADALPVGSTEVQRLVQEAVVEYLKNRRRTSADNLAQLRVDAKQRILDILEGL